MYNVPKSSLYYMLKRNPYEEINSQLKTHCIKDEGNLNIEEKNFIINNVSPPQPPITIDGLDSKMSNVFQSKNRKRDIKLFLKKEMNYSYKNGGSKIINASTQRNTILQSIFSSRWLANILDGKYFVNIDEASF